MTSSLLVIGSQFVAVEKPLPGSVAVTGWCWTFHQSETRVLFTSEMVTPMALGSMTSTPLGMMRPGERSTSWKYPVGHESVGIEMESQGLIVSRNASNEYEVGPVDAVAADAPARPIPAMKPAATAVGGGGRHPGAGAAVHSESPWY